MANKDKNNVKRFIQDVSVKAADDAYNGGGGSGSVSGYGSNYFITNVDFIDLVNGNI